MEELDFVHLHVHTGYSLLDGSGKINKIIQKACELNMKSIAITDHGAMYGCVEFYKSAIAAGIKPIIGCEVYVAAKSMHIKHNDSENSTHHLVLLVKNEKGYENLMKIVSFASIDGFYYKPRCDHEFLASHNEGLIALSACLAGEVQSYISSSDIKRAEEAALFYKNTFKDGFYLELQNHGMEEQIKYDKELIKMSERLSIPLVATNDIHYINKEDYKAHDILLCIQTGKTVNDENRMRYPSPEFYLKSPEEMYEAFEDIYEDDDNKKEIIKKAFSNTIKIADECCFDYKFHESKLPNFPLDAGIDHYEYLKDLCYKGFYKKYKNISEELTERLEYELSIIKKMGYVDYFLIVWDFIRFANENNIMTGPGRGSAAGSIVAYTLGITKIDPIRYGLIFERFLNPERVSMPDIDSDFCYERRPEVIDYVVEKYGKDNVSQIVTFGTMAARACIRDVGRAMAYSYAEVDKIAKMIPAVLNITIDKALELNPELKSAYDGDDRVKNLIDISRALEGLPRHTSTHAAGVVIASKPLYEFVPLLQNEGMIVTQFTMGTLEELGLLKMDFLGLRTLTVMRDAVSFIKQNRNIDVNIDDIDFEDSSVYDMIGEGNTVGVFQLESAGMTNFMKELKPTRLEDIIAGISLYRPGPMSEIPKYIENKNNPDKITYITPELKNILDVTYGCIIYQEQVMQIVRDLAGYSMGRSDLVRRAMSKKKHNVMEEERHNFINGIVDQNNNTVVKGCVRNGIKAENAEKIFNSMMDFASYAFNKSHAAAYAVVAYETAYLMKYYPVEFTAALLNSFMGDNDKVAYYIRFAKKLRIKVLTPSINISFSKFTVNKDEIRFGLAAVKNVGVNVIDNIIKIRNEKGKFTGFSDFCLKIDASTINKRAVESLIMAGAFDEFGIFRSKLLAVYESVLDSVYNMKKKNIEGQMNLFMDFHDSKETDFQIDYPDIKEFDKRYLLNMEKEMTGLYLSGHPLDDYAKTLERCTSIKISDIISVNDNNEIDENNIEEVKELKNVRDGDKVIIGGILSDVSRKITKNGNMMAFLRLSDLYGSIEIIVFPSTLNQHSALIAKDEMVIIRGKVSIREDEPAKIICESIKPLTKVNSEKIYILLKEKNNIKEVLIYLNEINEFLHGSMQVVLCTQKEKEAYQVKESLWLKNDNIVIETLKNKFGEKNVKIK